MHTLKVLSLTLSLFSCLTPAVLVTSPSAIDGQPLPDRWFSLSLEENIPEIRIPPSNATTSLAARTPVQVCERILTAVNNCFSIIGYTYTISYAIASTIKAQSDLHSCGTVRGSINGFRYTYYGTGRNCDTTALQKTIAGAIYHYLAVVEGNKVCGTQCLRLDHKGTWDGYIKFAKDSAFDENAYCGEGLAFAACASGGVNSF
ncbi:hypothetical protein CNMCM5793_008771 [Aspergillus hiratsukae]|uniref:Secreted protein CSS2 C-terminal domain-containing protein n=1 Tax=Aspergillus hiratsukae TaxID=1194566 RepID=A0A8H6UB09_9EURO|nr:hypothetical protein CNMCM5793_008771 [Aspergillus hiratsukae]KAF7157963.1 hypothetical protein CNMCM6106_004252 [Aspergillus hiratsukae]